METTIFRTIKGSQIEQLFETTDIINIRFYNAVNVSEMQYSNNKRYKFEIRIRHNEGSNAEELFDNAFSKLFPKKIKMRTFIYSIYESKYNRKNGATYNKANVYEIKRNIPYQIGVVEWNTGSFKGETSTVMNFLGSNGALPKKYAEGYMYDYKLRTFNILAV